MKREHMLDQKRQNITHTMVFHIPFFFIMQPRAPLLQNYMDLKYEIFKKS